MTDYKAAYLIGQRLALHKFAEEVGAPVDKMTKALDDLLEGKDNPNPTEVLDSSERQGSSSWGDKVELETPRNTGINV